jgi:hypothetical protein
MSEQIATQDGTPLNIEMSSQDIDKVIALGGTFYLQTRIPSSINLEPSTGLDMQELWPSDTYASCHTDSGEITAVFPGSHFGLAQFLTLYPEYTITDADGKNIVEHLTQTQQYNYDSGGHSQSLISAALSSEMLGHASTELER